MYGLSRKGTLYLVMSRSRLYMSDANGSESSQSEISRGEIAATGFPSKYDISTDVFQGSSTSGNEVFDELISYQERLRPMVTGIFMISPLRIRVITTTLLGMARLTRESNSSPVRIGERHYIDAGAAEFSHADVAVNDVRPSLIRTEADVYAALSAGAIGVTTSAPGLWGARAA